MTENWTPEEMERKANVPLIETAKVESIQERAKKDSPQGDGSSSLSFLTQNGIFFNSGDTLPPWWSPRRDTALSEFWKTVNVLAGAMYAMAAKMSTIPFRIEPRDMGTQSHIKEATRFERRIKESADFGAGWQTFFTKQVISLLGQDNGRFMEIIDLSPNKDGPVIGPAISVAHLDPSRCQRTGDADFPVIYNDLNGKRHRMHYTRVAHDSQLPSEKAEMHGVGLCAVSRATSYGQNMLDIAQYKEEKLGSRPLRGMMVVGAGLDAAGVAASMQVASGMSDNKGLERFSLMPILGSADIENPQNAVNLISLSDLPDGFSEKDSTTIAMAAISLAYGVDARELWPGLNSRSTQADAIVSHMKQRGKGPGQIIAATETMFNNYVLPAYLKFVFDFQDDAQDRQEAEIRVERSRSRKLNIEVEVTDVRYERQEMVRTGEMSPVQFKELELKDGRLPNGQQLDTLFFRDEVIYVEILTLDGISNPTDILGNDPEKVLNVISKQKTIGYSMLAKESRQIQERQTREAIAALEWLAEEYRTVEMENKIEEEKKPTSNEGDDPRDRQREEAQGAQSSPESVPLKINGDIDSMMTK